MTRGLGIGERGPFVLFGKTYHWRRSPLNRLSIQRCPGFNECAYCQGPS